MEEESPKQGHKKPFKPSSFMRARRPHLYSDSKSVARRIVTRSVLSYHLETLTNQKDEATFETFARRLAEKFISPNLRPQTGPTGGGDGKTDAETYPVAKAIALRWYVPDLAAAHERWAFAFSAKKDWRGKVKSDVASIVETDRGYPRIYFVTNQFVPAKDSAAVQDALLEKHGVRVTILDRTWLLERVFEGDSLDIAIDVLNVGAGTEHDVKETGPGDTKHVAALEKLEKAIGDGTKYVGTAHALVEDCHRAALLARNLEKPRHEVDGRFLRAFRLAREHKLQKLELMVIYDWAWTSYFWFDDAAALNSKYEDVESLAIDSNVADELERLSNLLPLLRTSVTFGALTAGDAKLDRRSSDLLFALERLQADTSQPNNALHAHALSLLTRLAIRANGKVEEGEEEDDLSDLWDEFRGVINASDGLGTFPFEAIADALTDVGEFIPESPAFDRLYETITDTLAARRNEGEAATRNSTRAFQKLEKELPYEAIRWFGRAVSLLAKDEYEDELIEALAGSSFAYEEAGLLWAARNYALAAVAVQLSGFSRSGSIAHLSPSILGRWFAIELRLGRIPYIVNAYQLGMMVSNAGATTDERREALSERQFNQSAMLGALLLKTPFDQLFKVRNLPDMLERLGLFHARLALLFLMGREDVLRAEGSVPLEETTQGYLEFFERWAGFDEALNLPLEPDYLLAERVLLNSRVLGCEITISCSNNMTSIGVAEAILGALEALLATSLNHRILPHLDQLHLRVDPADASKVAPTLTFLEEDGTTVGIVTHAPQLIYKTREEVLSFPYWLQETVLQIFLRFAVPGDLDDWENSVLKEENGFSRALMFSNVPSTMNLLFGTNRERLSIDEWIEEDDVSYETTRELGWIPRNANSDAQISGPPKFEESKLPTKMFDFERLKHTDVRVVSPIDVRKWDAAKWRAALFMTVPDADDVPPILCLAFLNDEPAAAIFRGWRGRFGWDDPDNTLRIAIIRGVWASNPHAYALVIGPNTENFPTEPAKTFEFVSRILVMTPTNSQNLDRFLAEYERHGRYMLAPAHLPTLAGTPRPMMDTVLGKYHLVVREAWEIGDNDLDLVALDPEDPPVIPPNQPEAPVIRALSRLRSRRGKRVRPK